jgi:hypothetical protein
MCFVCFALVALVALVASGRHFLGRLFLGRCAVFGVY